MKERQISAMSTRASSLLRRASGAFEPSFADKTKTRAAIARRLALGVAAGAAVAAGAKSAAAAPSIAPAAIAPGAVLIPAAAPVAAGFAGVGFATKLVAAVAIVGSLSAGAVGVHRATHAPTRITASSVSPTPAAQKQASSNAQQSAAPEVALPQAAVSSPTSSEPIAPIAIANQPRNKPVHAAAADSPKTKVTTPPVRANALQGAEVELFQRAQRAVQSGDDTAALALLDEQAQRFPNSALAEDRDAARVLALCGAGRQEEAAVSGSAFLSAHPNSIQASRVRSSCANGPSADGSAQ